MSQALEMRAACRAKMGMAHRVGARGGEREAGAVVGRVDEDMHARCGTKSSNQAETATAPPGERVASEWASRAAAQPRRRRSAVAQCAAAAARRVGRGAPGPAAALSVARRAESRPSEMYTLQASTGADVAAAPAAPRDHAGAPRAPAGVALARAAT